jgi:hypothetical protein
MYKSRIFSNHKDVTFNDYIAKKRRTTLIHPEMQKNLMIKKYYDQFSCDKAPMKIVDYPTSYSCSNNIYTLSKCKNAKNILYPYGHYMCATKLCNICINIGNIPEPP